MKDYSKSKYYKKARVIRGGGVQLPPGGYECVVKNAKIEENDWGDRLCVAIDIITEGDYYLFFEENFKKGREQDDDYKWKGVLRITLPKDDGSKEDEWKQNGLKTLIADFEESNPGFFWNWDESKLKDKKIGILFRKHFTVIDGRDISYTEAWKTALVEDIRESNFKEPQDYYDKRWKDAHANTAPSDWMEVDEDSDEGVPF